MYYGICASRELKQIVGQYKIWNEVVFWFTLVYAIHVPQCLHTNVHNKKISNDVFFRRCISYICTRIARNNAIISKLRHYLALLLMKQIYYSLIYPYISYAILEWGSAYKTHIGKIQGTKHTPILETTKTLFTVRTA